MFWFDNYIYFTLQFKVLYYGSKGLFKRHTRHQTNDV